MKLIGVYGTLRKNERASSFLKEAKFIKTIRKEIPYIMIDTCKGYPALLKNIAKTSPIVLDIFEINETIEDKLDIYEGYPHLFQKDIIDIDGKEIIIYVYTKESCKKCLQYNKNLKKIESGDWVEYNNKNN